MFCGKCGAKIEDGGNFCPKCGSSVSEQYQIIAADSTAAANNIDKRKLAVLIIIAVIAAILIKTIFFSTPLTLSGNENNPKKILKAANSYFSSEEFKNQDGNVYDYTATNFVGKLGDYYQFVIIGTINVDGTVIEYTEDDDVEFVLTENEDGITYVPVKKWFKEYNVSNDNYKSNNVNVILKNVHYEFDTGKLVVETNIHNGYSNSVTLKSLELTFFNGDDNPFTETVKFSLIDSISGGKYNSYTFRFQTDQYKFIPNLNNITYKSTITYNR